MKRPGPRENIEARDENIPIDPDNVAPTTAVD